MPAMSFLEHLEELRKRIIYSLIAVTVGFFACWNYHEFIFRFVQRPVMDALQRNGMAEKLVYLNPTEPFNLYLKVAFLAGLFVTSPFVLYQVWLFISPGLYRNEKRYVLPFMFSTVFLFLAGGLFAYKMVYPAALNFLRQAVPTDDYHRRIYRSVFNHHAGNGRDFRNADPGVFFIHDGHRKPKMDVA